ncbi:MAG: hypothetical protein AB7D57_02235 [Desulfovibrionaceae bacterium]
MSGEYGMLPYAEVDGVRNVPDSFVAGLYERVLAEGGAHVFRDGSIPTAAAFVRMARQTGTAFYLLFVRGEPAGALWLNRFECRFARLHHFVFREFWGPDTLKLARYCMGEIFAMADETGRPLLDGLMGSTPADNRLALSLTLRCGFKRVGVLPFGAYDAATQTSGPAVLTAMTRADAPARSDGGDAR